MATLLIDEPRDLLLGPDNDLVITDDLQFTAGLAAIAQDCRIAMLMFQGEWFLDLDAGIPYWQSILGQKTTVAKKAAAIAIRSALLAVDGVQEVTKLEVSVDVSRRMKVKWQVRCAFGETPADTIVLRIAGAA